MDRRLPVAGGTLAAILGSTSALPREASLFVLLAIPAVLVWFLRTTIAHSRSKEDVLRRIDEIERQVNQLAGEELLAFQSRHPNRHRAVSGRTGRGTVTAVLWLCLAALAGCVVTWWRQFGADLQVLLAYIAYTSIAAVDLIACNVRVRRYRYIKSPPEASTLFRAW
jgi:cytochrome c biogenesis protein CcdA